MFAGAGDVGVFTQVLPNSRNAHLGRIERVSAEGDDLHWVGGALYGASAAAPRLNAVSRAP